MALAALLVFASPAQAAHTVSITAPANDAVYQPLATVSFTSGLGGTCSGPVYLWNFGDGVGTSVLANPTYAYAVAGTYTVNLQITCLVAESTSASPISLRIDGTPPTLTLPSPVTAEATGPSGAAVSFSATATDNILTPAPTVACAPVSGSTFALGATSVSCTATDAAGLTATGTFTVTVVDTTLPTLTLPSPITAEATGPNGVAVSFSVSATDLVSGALTPTCTPTSGSTFALGATSVSCSVTDGAGNTRTGSFTVTVQDTTQPTLTLPGTQTVQATSASGATVSFSVSATDLVSGALTPTCTPAGGGTFPLGTTSVSCTVTDGAGNTRSGSFDVVVQDTTSPALSLPTPFTVEATSGSGATASFTATASDLVSGSVTPACSPSSGSTFPLGATSVSCTATDAAGNVASGSFGVTVSDTTPPTVTTGGNVARQTTSDSGEAVTFSATASDLVTTALAPLCAPASGSVFPLGVTTVVCTATDAAGNAGTGTFTVTLSKDAAGLPYSQWYGGAGPDGGAPAPAGGGGGGGGGGGSGSGGGDVVGGSADEGGAGTAGEPDTGSTDGPGGGAPGADDEDGGTDDRAAEPRVDDEDEAPAADAGGDGADAGSDGALAEFGHDVGSVLERVSGGAPPALAAVSAASTTVILALATFLRRVWLPVRA